MRNYNYNLIETTDKVKQIYYLYLAGVFSFYITGIIGYFMAWRETKNKSNSVLLDLHYSYQFRIMNINGALNVVLLLGTISYICYLFTTIDFMNINIEKELSGMFKVLYFWVTLNVATTLFFYYQVINGLNKINNNEPV